MQRELPPRCTKLVHGIHKFASAKGKYVHPHFCFQKGNVKSHCGFSVREDDNYTQHDLRGEYSPSISTWSQQIYQATSAKRVFPVGTCDKQILIIKNHSSAHWYKALQSLIELHHPAFATHPTTVI